MVWAIPLAGASSAGMVKASVRVSAHAHLPRNGSTGAEFEALVQAKPAMDARKKVAIGRLFMISSEVKRNAAIRVPAEKGCATWFPRPTFGRRQRSTSSPGAPLSARFRAR